LSGNPNSAFSKLMEWQMSGGDEADKRPMEPEGQLTETEEIADDLMGMDEKEGEAFDEELVEERKEHTSNTEAALEKARKRMK
jgi:putative ABC transport system ATP-binding protein